MHERTSSSPIDRLSATLVDQQWVPSPIAALPVALVRFFRDGCVPWGATLAYYTLIGLIPLLTATFSILKGVGLHHGLTPFVVSTIGAGSPQVSRQIVEFIDRTNMRAVGTLSVIAAVLAVFAIVGTAEVCFNRIWGGVPGRPLKRKLATYAKVATLAPFALVSTLALTAALQPGSRTYAFFDSLYLGDVVLVMLRLLPYALLWFSFTLVYTRLPNTVVRLRSAIWGAIIAGTLWQFAQWTYVTFVIRLVRYSAVYGALWQLPILLAWIYIGWLIVLSGAEVCRTYDDVVGERNAQAVRRRAQAGIDDTARIATDASPATRDA
jgi:membrane protein